jgi:MFS family permease
MVPAVQEPDAALVRRRRRTFLIVAGVLGVAWAIPLFGFPSLVLGWIEGGERLQHRVHDLGYGAWAGLFMAVGYLSQLRAPERRIAGFQQAVVALGAMAVAVALSVDAGPILLLVLGFAVLTAVLGVYHPSRDRLLQAPERPIVPLLALAILAAIPLTMYAVEMAELQRNGLPADPHVAERHWSTMAAMALSIWFVAALAGLRTPGWRIPAWSAGLAAAVFGLSSIVFPAYPGSVGSTWGLVAVVGGVIFVAVAEGIARRGSARQPEATG